MVRFVSVFVVLITANVLAQKPVRVKLNGKVSVDISSLEGLYVINLKTEEATIAQKDGCFAIPAAVGDTLMFSAVRFKGIRMVLTPKHFENELFVVRMEPIMNQLKEVVVRRYDNINAVSLGIIPKGQKSYTPAERKYTTASSGRMNPMGLDPLLNLLYGRTSMLKKELVVEGKESCLRQLYNMFDAAYFIDKLKIPSDYVKGFQYYLVENERFVRVLKSKNKTNIEFVMGELATKYKEIIADENK